MKKGFTLIELLVVVLIIGILAAMAVPQYRKAVYRAQMTEAIVATKAIYDAEQVYMMANGDFTDDFNDLGLGYPINETNSAFASLPKGACSLENVMSGKVVYCVLREVLTFQRSLVNGKVICCSYPETNHAADSICKAETGASTWYNGCSEGYPCHCFREN